MRLTRLWLRAVVVTGLMSLTVVACAPARTGAADPIKPIAGLPRLTWLGEFTRPAASRYPQIADRERFGSLSGLARDPEGTQWMAVIDDREGSRVAWLSISFTGGVLEVSPTGMQPLRPGPGVEDRIATEADLEGVVALPDGSFMAIEEGHLTEQGQWPPALLQVTRDGLVTQVVAFPAEFQLAAGGKTGVRDNQGFESLTRTPLGRLIAGLEQPLANQPITTPARGGNGQLIEFVPSGATWRPGRQWHYAISATPVMKGFPTLCDGGENGLVELLAITETTLIAMERACWLNASGTEASNAVKLFAVTLSGNVARKTLLLDLSTLTAKLTPALANLENFEGLAFGPPVAGMPSLLVMSDDNFRATQKTSFLLFSLR